MNRSHAVRSLAAAVSLLPLLAACGSGSHSHSATGGKTTAGSSGQLDVPADANADLRKQYLLENAIAACMKKQGFTYTPVAPEDPAASWATDGADYALTKKYRQKYGFGIFSGIVYPNDASAPGSAGARKDSGKTPNAAYVETLTPDQKTSYNKALGTPPTRRPERRTGPAVREAPTSRFTAPLRPRSGAPRPRARTRPTHKHSTAIRSWWRWRSRTPRV